MRRERVGLALCCGFLLALTLACGPESTPAPTVTPPPDPPAGPLRWPLWTDPGVVQAIAVADDGTVYVGGSFTRMGPMTGGGVPVDATTGALATRFAAVDGAVYAAAPDGSGGWYVGGDFLRVGGQPRRNLAHILPDGSLDPSWVADTTVTTTVPGGTDEVRALAFENGVLYVAGAFDTLGGVARPGLGALDASGAVTDWAPAITPSWGVFTLSPHGGTIYLGGWFTEVGGQPRSSLAAVDAAGSVTSWNPQAEGTEPSPYQPSISALLVVGDTVYIGGTFDRVGGQPRSAVAAVDDAGVPTSWAPRLGPPANSTGTPLVQALASENGTLYVGGNFGQVEGQTRSGLAAFDSAGQLKAWAPELDHLFVDGLAASGGTVYVSGEFSRAGLLPRSRFAAFDAGGAPTSWDPDADEGYGHAIAVSGNQVYAGGSFKWIGKATKRAGLAAIDPTGRVTDWNPRIAVGVVHALALSGATVYVGGVFSEIGGQPRLNLAAIDASGSVTPWSPQVEGPVYALAVGNGLVYAGGQFGTVNGVARDNLAAVDASGSLTGWNPRANAFVTSLSLDGPTLYAGGYFTAVGGLARTNLAAIHALSGAPLPWSPAPAGSYGFAGPYPQAAFAPSGVWSVALAAGTVYFVGDFKTVGGLPRDRIAAVDASGTPTPFVASDLGIDLAHTVCWGLNRVLIGGSLVPQVEDDGVFTASLAMVEPGFAIATLLSKAHGPVIIGSPYVQTIAVHGDVAYLGGFFWGTSGSARRWGLAAVDADGRLTGWDPNAFP